MVRDGTYSSRGLAKSIGAWNKQPGDNTFRLNKSQSSTRMAPEAQQLGKSQVMARSSSQPWLDVKSLNLT